VRNYTLHLPLRFIARPPGIIYLVTLLAGLVCFLVFGLDFTDHRQVITYSTTRLFKALAHFSKHAYLSIRSYFNHLWQRTKVRASFWKRLFTVTILVAFLYIFMEWLFTVTMPSFMSPLSIPNKVEIFLLSGLGFSLFCIAVIAAFIITDFIAMVAHISGITRHLGMVIPTIILSALGLLLIDNFTYTLFKFGISTSTGIARGAYGLLFVLLFVYIFFHLLSLLGLRGNPAPKEQTIHRLYFISIGILVITAGLALVKMYFSNILPSNTSAMTQHSAQLLNILLLGSDGLNAENLSVYGYYRDTTPHLVELA